MIQHESLRELHMKFQALHPDIKVSLGSFHALKPFNVRQAVLGDIEMCCCIYHVNVKNAVTALCEQFKILIPDFPVTYQDFLSELIKNCPKDAETTHISWDCTPDSKTRCDHIMGQWDTLRACFSQTQLESTIKATRFVPDLNGRLSADNGPFTVKNVLEFIEKKLTHFIHHRNQLQHLREAQPILKMLYGSTPAIEIDFSENLTIPINHEAQSMHWTHRQVTVHTSVINCGSYKLYHGALSDILEHDTVFTKSCLDNLLENYDTESTLIIESDNCSSQYKCAAHFYDIQSISNTTNCTVIRIYGVSGHGKGEADGVGSIIKTAVRREVARDNFFKDAEGCVAFLNSKFVNGDGGLNRSVQFRIIELGEADLDRRPADNMRHYTVTGSSKFQIIIFTPYSRTFKAAPRICVCDQCFLTYGSCSLFKEYEPRSEGVESLQRTLRDPEVPDEAPPSLLLPGVVCAILPSESSTDTFWLVHIETISHLENMIFGYYLERHSTKNNLNVVYRRSTKISSVCMESVVFPFVNVQESKKGFFTLVAQEFTELSLYFDSFST